MCAELFAKKRQTHYLCLCISLMLTSDRATAVLRWNWNVWYLDVLTVAYSRGVSGVIIGPRSLFFHASLHWKKGESDGRMSQKATKTDQQFPLMPKPLHVDAHGSISHTVVILRVICTLKCIFGATWIVRCCCNVKPTTKTSIISSLCCFHVYVVMFFRPMRFLVCLFCFYAINAVSNVSIYLSWSGWINFSY